MPYHVVISRRILVFCVVILLLLLTAGIAYVYLPHAQIILSPTTYERPSQRQIILSSSAREPDFVRYVLPASVVERAIEETKTFQRPAEIVREDFSQGEVTLYNEHDEEQQLLPKTHLRHEATGVFFLTDSPVAIPPRSSARMRVTAKEKGASGNVAPGKFIIDKLPVSLQEVVYAEGTHSFVGGIVTDQPLREEELHRAQNELLAQAQGRALGELVAEAGGAVIHEELVHVETLESSSSAVVGTSPVDYSLRIALRARAFIIDDNDALSLTLLSLRSQTSPEEEFVRYDPSSFSLRTVRVDHDRGEAVVEGGLTGMFARKIEPTLFSSRNLAGLAESEVTEYFKQFPSVGDVSVHFSPFWVTTVPVRVGAVEIVVQNSTE